MLCAVFTVTVASFLPTSALPFNINVSGVSSVIAAMSRIFSVTAASFNASFNVTAVTIPFELVQFVNVFAAALNWSPTSETVTVAVCVATSSAAVNTG